MNPELFEKDHKLRSFELSFRDGFYHSVYEFIFYFSVGKKSFQYGKFIFFFNLLERNYVQVKTLNYC